MRELAIGDIHGCLSALRALEAFVPFREAQLITLGDYVDRGPDSRGVIDWLMERQASGRLLPLRGNHEAMMLQARYDPAVYRQWMGLGGNATLRSYAPPGEVGRLEHVPETHWRFLESTMRWHESDANFFVHGNVAPDVPLADQLDQVLYWQSFGEPPPHCSGKRMICGHSSQKSGLPKSVGHAVCIDTRAYGDGWLTCLDVGAGQYWQARQTGETRTEFLPVRR